MKTMRRETRSMRLWPSWVLANAIGEGLGLGGSFLIGAVLFAGLANAPGVAAAILTAAIAVVLGTLCEGVIVGVAQWLVLRRWVPGIRGRAWVTATAVGAAVAWLLGMIPSTAMSLAGTASDAGAPPPEPSAAVMYLLAAGMGLVLGPILALPQWVVLRRHVTAAGWWIPANAVAWMCGMPLTFVGPSLISPEGITASAVLAIAASLLATGAVVGMIHGAALRWLLHRRT